MTTLLDWFSHAVRLTYGAAMFLFLIPVYVLHEGAHAVAALPWGGPSGAYVVVDDSEDGALSRIPVGAAIYHSHADDRVADAVISFAPVLLMIPGYAVSLLPGLWAQAAGATMFLAGFMGLSDAVAYFNIELYEDVVIRDGYRHRLIVDFTELGVEAETPPDMIDRNDDGS